MSKRSTRQRTRPKPTFSGLATLLDELADEIELGDTARLQPLIEQVRTLAVELGPIERSRRIQFSTGTVVKVTKRRSGTKVADVCRTDDSRTISAQGPGPDQLRTDDRTVSDLNEVTKLCFGVQIKKPAAQVALKLQTLAKRFRDRAGKRQSSLTYLQERLDNEAKRPQRKRRAAVETKPLTARQAEIVQIVGECKGDIAEAARRLGVDRKTVDEGYKAALSKLGVKAVGNPSTKSLPADRRGQTELADADEGPASPKLKSRRVQRDRRTT